MRDWLRGADLVHRLLADLGGRLARRAPGQRPAGVPPAADQARIDLRRQRPHRAGRNRKSTQDAQTIYTRRYPFGGLFAQVVGYNTVDQGRTGIELSYNDFLTSSNANLSTELQNLGDSLRGRTITGDNLITSLSLPAQRAAMAGLGQMRGAVVAIQPSTGRVLAMASTPTFNPNHVVTNFAKLNRAGSGAPLLNRATQGLYTPGSTFKTVTATAALKSRKYTPTSPLTPAPVVHHGVRTAVQRRPGIVRAARPD